MIPIHLQVVMQGNRSLRVIPITTHSELLNDNDGGESSEKYKYFVWQPSMLYFNPKIWHSV